jgi:hypothetical protein
LIQYVNGPPFLTALDPEARVKGSRDPLGLELIWTSLGRALVGNLTTVTRSVRQFTTLLTGIHFASQVSPRGDEEDGFLSAFLRFEQLAAYSRYLHFEQAHGDIRGVRAVRRNLNEGGGTVAISVLPEAQILSSQQAYGIYGLFRMAARASGLLEDALEDRLARTGQPPTVADIIEQQVAALPKAFRQEILLLISRNGKISIRLEVLQGLSHLLRPKLMPQEVSFYGPYLVRGEHLVQDDLRSIQAGLWEVMRAVSSGRDEFRWNHEFSMKELMACIDQAPQPGDSDLKNRLDRVRRCEELLGLSARLFDYLIGQDGQAMTAVAAAIRQAWPAPPSWLEVSDLKDVFDVGGSEVPDRMFRLAEHLRSGDYQRACKVLLEQNAEVMRSRGGGPWIVLDKDIVKVRYREQAGRLPGADELRSLWVHTYFLNSLKRLGGQVYYGQVGGGPDEEE